MVDAVRDATGGGAHVVVDCVGGSMLAGALGCLRRGGRLVAITVGDRQEASFPMADFYHNECRLFGADTLKLDLVAARRFLHGAGAGFADGSFSPPPIAKVFPLAQAREAYEFASSSPDGRVVVVPSGPAVRA